MKHIARKRFGQNFLQDDRVLGDIIDSIAPAAGDTMVEIGPGLAAMTDLLLKSLPHMHVVELDRDLVARLEQRYPRQTHRLTWGTIRIWVFATNRITRPSSIY